MKNKVFWGIILILCIGQWVLFGMGCVSDASAQPAANGYNVKTIYHSGHSFLVYESAAGVGIALIPE